MTQATYYVAVYVWTIQMLNINAPPFEEIMVGSEKSVHNAILNMVATSLNLPVSEFSIRCPAFEEQPMVVEAMVIHTIHEVAISHIVIRRRKVPQ